MNIWNDGLDRTEKTMLSQIEIEIESSRTKWNGKIHIISDERFFALLTDNEYALYLALKTISYHDNKGKHYLYNNQINYKQLANKLSLKANKNKVGENAIMSRQSIAKLFVSLVDKKILEHGIVREYKSKEGYFIIDENKYKFIRINSEFLKILTKNLKGEVLKTYIYIKAAYEHSLRNGNKSLFINRETIAKAINEVSKKGDIGKRQLDNITSYITLLCDLNLIIVKVRTTKKTDGNYSACLEVSKVNEELKESLISIAS